MLSTLSKLSDFMLRSVTIYKFVIKLLIHHTLWYHIIYLIVGGYCDCMQLLQLFRISVYFIRTIKMFTIALVVILMEVRSTLEIVLCIQYSKSTTSRR